MRTRDFLVGLTFFGLLTILAVSTIFFADFSFSARHERIVHFENAGGLFEGAEVRIDGLVSGRVRGLGRVPGQRLIRVTLSFDEEPVLNEGLVVSIASPSPLGGRMIEIMSGDPKGEPWKEESLGVWPGPQGSIDGAVASIEEFVSQLKEKGADGRTLVDVVRDTVEEIEAKVGDEEGIVHALFSDPELKAKVQSTVASVEDITGKLAAAQNGLGWLLGDPKAAANVVAALGNIEKATADLARAKNGLSWLLGSDKAADKAVTALGNIETATSKLAEADSGLGWLLGDEDSAAEVVAALKSLRGAADDIKVAAYNLTRGEGILQMLLTDVSAKKEVRNSIKALSDFIETTRENAPITTFAGIILSPF
ncbi:MAG: MlaD family protein [Planctomycetota bacterium]